MTVSKRNIQDVNSALEIAKFNGRSVLTEDGECDTEIRRRIGIAKGTFQKLSKVIAK